MDRAPRNLVHLICLGSLLLGALPGCNLFPDIRKKPEYNNPFPQLSRVAVLPFYNQSDEPTLSGDRVAMAYYNELQLIPGFEVLPVGAVEAAMQSFGKEPQTGADFQEFARFLGVDAVLVGSVTDYTPYYPPRMTIRVNWYAANPGFHPVPNGYGMPWGTKKEKHIPAWVELEAERELARAQLDTQTPLEQPEPVGTGVEEQVDEEAQQVQQAVAEIDATPEMVDDPAPQPSTEPSPTVPAGQMLASDLPTDWPDPRGLVPPEPSLTRPPLLPQHAPIITHMRAFNGHDDSFTEKLENYVYFLDDARSAGSLPYLERSEDFIRFCCHLHLTETLTARGGQPQHRLILRWPIGRYQR